MILDKKSLFADALAVTATANSPSIDMGDDVGHGNAMFTQIGVTEDFATLTSLQVILQHSDDDATFEDVLLTADVSAAKLKAGYRFALEQIPHATKRYVRLRFVVTGTNATAGKITAGITPTLQAWYGANQKLGGYRSY